MCCSLWDRKESDTTERLNNNSICLERKELRILEKEMATHSSILAWRIPWTEEPGGLQFMASQRTEHNLVNNTLINSCIAGGRNDAEAETPVLWPTHVKS